MSLVQQLRMHLMSRALDHHPVLADALARAIHELEQYDLIRAERQVYDEMYGRRSNGARQELFR